MGRFFRIDPALVLESDYWTWAVRIAAFQYGAEEEKKAAEKNSKRKGDSRINRMA